MEKMTCPKCGKPMAAGSKCECGFTGGMSEEKADKAISSRRNAGCAVGAVGFLALIAGTVLMFASDQKLLAAALWVVGFALIFLSGAITKKAGKVVNEMLGDFFAQEDERIFSPLDAPGCPPVNARASRVLLGLVPWEKLFTEDALRGVHNGVPFAAANVRSEHEERSYDSDGGWSTDAVVDYSGVWLTLWLNRDVASPVYVRERVEKLRKNKIKQMPGGILTGDAGFDEQFAVECGDSEAARELLNPSLRDALRRVDELSGAKSFFEFQGGILNIALDTERRFRNRGEASASSLEEARGLYIASLEYVAKLIDVMKESGAIRVEE